MWDYDWDFDWDCVEFVDPCEENCYLNIIEFSGP